MATTSLAIRALINENYVKKGIDDKWTAHDYTMKQFDFMMTAQEAEAAGGMTNINIVLSTKRRLEEFKHLHKYYKKYTRRISNAILDFEVENGANAGLADITQLIQQDALLHPQRPANKSWKTAKGKKNRGKGKGKGGN
jgi:hypothetical protein